MRVLDVRDLTAYLKELVEFDPILSDIWVRGEVTNLTTSAAGHSYFSLTGNEVHLNCVLFRANRMRVLAPPRNGDAVLAHGRIAIYEPRGQYQLIVDNVAPEGVGILQLQFEEIRRRLESEGLFATERKRPLPELPRAIGVVTSEHGAVWHDIQNVVARRFPLVRLILAPSSVQGSKAPGELIAALQALEESGEPDVIIIGRGGGSAEDLAAFNDEALARAIFACSVPVVSAVGHETDTCIADMVADVRAPTPSAAAELCVPDQRALLAQAFQCVTDARAAATQIAAERRLDLSLVRTRLARQSPAARISAAQQSVDGLRKRATSTVQDRLEGSKRDVAALRERASLLNPMDVLRRGYAVISRGTATGEVRVTSAREAATYAELRVTFSDGRVVVQPRQERT